MKQGTVFLDVEEYERIKNSNQNPETYCTKIEGYWIIAVPAIVYELEFKGLLTDEEKMSTYILWG